MDNNAPIVDDVSRGPVPCPLCKQYSHSLGADKVAEAFMHFHMMFAHRGDGIPTQHCFDEETRDHAQVLLASARKFHLADEALEEALRRYPEAHGALAFFWFASGLGQRYPSEEQLARAREKAGNL